VSSLRVDFAWIIAAYATALAAALLTAELVPVGNVLWLTLTADVVATLVIFAFSRAFDNSSFYDAYWSVAPPVLLGFWCYHLSYLDLRLSILSVLVILWAMRLTHNWARGWQGLGHVDWRYVDLRKQTGVMYPLVDLSGIHLLPTVLVFLGCVPLWLLTSATVMPFGIWDSLWIAIGFSALWLEYRADNVLREFRLSAQPGEVLRHDVWSKCRHPNYLGELGFWLALAVAGYAGSGSLWSWIGFLGMTLLFVGVSIPMIDKRQLANKPAYADYKREVASLIPGLKF
jgi:steroid 5-alpha reductase family enzyme